MNASAHYRQLDPAGLANQLAALPFLRDRLGGNPPDWTIREVSDGNLNTVWLVHGPAGSLCAKQSLPHVRVDPSWKMPLDRTTFEAAWLRETEAVAPGMVPPFLHFDPHLYLLVTGCLDDYVTLTEALARGENPAPIAREIGFFIAQNTFHHSFRGTSFENMARLEGFFSGNTTLTRITVDLVLTDPYHAHPRNHFHPALTTLVERLHTDGLIHGAVCHLQERFFTTRQALLHGDLHSGSVMVRNGKSSVIDGEFSLIGPIGFDLGMFAASLVLAGFAAASEERRQELHNSLALLHDSFLKTYCHEWMNHEGAHDLSPSFLMRDKLEILSQQQKRECAAIVEDAAGFAAMEIVRRLTGYAHTPHFETLSQEASGDRQHDALCFAIDLLSDLSNAAGKLFGTGSGLHS
ncbi:S-methyl-5-thioribose kinase [Acetobacter conturbans]|uniref:S-methyl-5-thioribose kinase n=1 Tax=Acetobacter conturbans TaxID=1737472 RepID=UPI00156A2B34